MARLTSISVRGAFGHNHYSPAEFVKLSLTERIQLIISQRVEFFDEHGNNIPSLDAVDQLPHAALPEAPKPK